MDNRSSGWPFGTRTPFGAGCKARNDRASVRTHAQRPSSRARIMQRIFSGIQPSGIPTLGNYLGALRNWAALQEGHECIYCVVDLHAIPVFQDPKELRRRRAGVAATLLAIGIDPSKHIVVLQSAVRAHAQLAWIFNCVARLGWLNRMTQFKDKAGKDREDASSGLYVYPNLMAAEIHPDHATR